MTIRPPHWEVDADERLGTDLHGRVFYRLKDDVYGQQDGNATRWVCTMSAWPAYCRTHGVKLES